MIANLNTSILGAFVATLVALEGCARALQPIDVTRGPDVAAVDASTLDAFADTAPDASSTDHPDDAAADASARDVTEPDGSCNPDAETFLPGLGFRAVCDARGNEYCQSWAQTNFTPGIGFGTCVVTGSSCARADRCSDPFDEATCRCGMGPECVPGEVCSALRSGDTPRCRCIVH